MAFDPSGANFIHFYQAPAADRTLVVSILKWPDKVSRYLKCGELSHCR